MTGSTQHDDNEIEILADGLTREWRRNRKLVVYTLHSFALPVVTAYLDSCTLMIRDEQPCRPEYGIHHFAVSDIKITSAVYRQLMKLADCLHTSHHRAVAGVIVPNTWSFRSLISLGDIFARRSGDVQVCYFVDPVVANRWIEGVIDRDAADEAASSGSAQIL